MDDEALKTMYPSMSQTAPVLAPAPTNVAALRDERKTLTAAYPTMNESRLNDAGYGDDIEMAPQQARQQRAELGQLFDDIGASHQDAGYAVSAARRYRQNPPTEQELATMREQAKQQLSAIYGKDAPQALRDAQALATRDPRWKALLESTHLGSDPGFVVRMAEMARRERSQGRLK